MSELPNVKSNKPGLYPFTNGVIFRNVMRDAAFCKELVSRVMGKPIQELTYNNTEQVVELHADGHHIRLDLMVCDSGGILYDVEMEKHCRMPTLARRSRYYASLLDATYMHKHGAVFNYATDVSDAYVIFICTFDPFSDGRHCYSFTMRCQENPALELGDGMTILLLNAQGTQEDCSPELKNFLDFVDGKASQTDEFVVQLQQRVEEVNQIPEVRRAAMDWETELNDVATQSRYEGRLEGRVEGRAEGRAEGVQEERGKFIRTLAAKGKSPQEITALTDFPLDEVQKYL